MPRFHLRYIILRALIEGIAVLGWLFPNGQVPKRGHVKSTSCPNIGLRTDAEKDLRGVASLWGNIYRTFGLHDRANDADAEREEGRLLIAEHNKPENRYPRRVTYDEIMEDLATGNPGRFLDRKVQAYMAGDNWPPTTMTETFDTVRARGIDNAWTTSVTGVEKLLLISHPGYYQSISLRFGPARASFKGDGRVFAVQGRSSAMALMMAVLAIGRFERSGASE